MSGPVPEAGPGPLVKPGEPLTVAELRRYSRHLLLADLGELGQRRLKAARVLLIGAGGLGSPALQYLAAAGVGTIGLVDDDLVEESNLQRQVVHTTADLGRPKVDSAADAVARANPLVRIERHQERFTADNAVRLVAGYHLVLDGSDNFDTRYLVNDACVLTGKPWIWAAVLRFEGQVSTFWAEHGPQYRDLFPQPPAAGTVPDCSEAGVLGAVCGLLGSVMATEAIKLLTGVGQTLLGRVLVVDTLTWSWRNFRLSPDPSRPPVTEIEPAPLPTISAAELAGRLRARDTAQSDTAESGTGKDAFLLVDVREPAEHALDAIPGSLLIPLGTLATARLPLDQPIILHCARGGRSAQALRLLRGLGYTQVSHLDGGMAAWNGAMVSPSYTGGQAFSPERIQGLPQ